MKQVRVVMIDTPAEAECLCDELKKQAFEKLKLGVVSAEGLQNMCDRIDMWHRGGHKITQQRKPKFSTHFINPNGPQLVLNIECDCVTIMNLLKDQKNNGKIGQRDYQLRLNPIKKDHHEGKCGRGPVWR